MMLEILIILLVITIQGAIVMSAIDNLIQATAVLKLAVEQIVIPSNNDAQIQAATDSINNSIANLQAKVTPTVA